MRTSECASLCSHSHGPKLTRIFGWDRWLCQQPLPLLFLLNQMGRQAGRWSHVLTSTLTAAHSVPANMIMCVRLVGGHHKQHDCPRMNFGQNFRSLTNERIEEWAKLGSLTSQTNTKVGLSWPRLRKAGCHDAIFGWIPKQRGCFEYQKGLTIQFLFTLLMSYLNLKFVTENCGPRKS